jgi:hypothetical protein
MMERPDSDQSTRQGRPVRRPLRRPEGPPPEPTPREPRPAPGESGLYVPWWGFALVILTVAGLTCGLWGYVLFGRPAAAAPVGSTPTPVIILVTPTPTIGAEPLVNTPQEVPTTAPIAEELPTPESENVIVLGGSVVVAGTEGSGVAIRQGPGTSYQWMAIGNEGDVFLVQDGPRENDGYTWWFIVDPQDANRAGWAAGEFLQAVEQ